MMPTENTNNIVPCQDYARMTEIWLVASAEAHGFISRSFWEANAGAMSTQYLPAAENYAYLEDGIIAGFICLNDNHIEALFVDPQRQGRGIGKALLDKAKTLRSRLTLAVYSENLLAVEFYARNGFTLAEERTDSATGHPEKVMRWQAT